MTLFKCKYCGIDKDLSENSEEHVIPESLGGLITLKMFVRHVIIKWVYIHIMGDLVRNFEFGKYD